MFRLSELSSIVTFSSWSIKLTQTHLQVGERAVQCLPFLHIVLIVPPTLPEAVRCEILEYEGRRRKRERGL